jgi:hypothetical protein
MIDKNSSNNNSGVSEIVYRNKKIKLFIWRIRYFFYILIEYSYGHIIIYDNNNNNNNNNKRINSNKIG